METSSNLLKLLACLFIVMAFSFTACKKDRSARKYANDIYGPWHEGVSRPRRLGFDKNGKITVQVPNEDLELRAYFGTFTIKADSLSFELTTTASKYGANGPLDETVLDTPISSSGTYKLQGDSLVLNISGYPAGSDAVIRSVYYRPVDEL